MLALVIWAICNAAKGGPGYTMEVYQESTGVYFEHLGHVTLSHTSWTIIVYVLLSFIDKEMFNLEQYVRYKEETCSKMIVRNWTVCNHFGEIMAYKLRHIKTTRQLLFEIVQVKNENSRQARGLFNFVGKVSKTLFGTLDDDDAQLYHEHIERLKQGTTTLTQLMKQQLKIVKSVLCTFNETLTDVEYNEIKMAEGLKQLQRHVNTFGTQLENTTYLLSLKIAIESHIAKALDASQAVHRTLDLLVESLAKAKEGTLSPRVMSPVLLLDTLKNGVSSFPPRYYSSFPVE